VRNDFASHLLAWYDDHSLSLPWRNSNDPYKIYLSEVMLQQTQVKTVLPYYKKWVNNYPTVQSVANATQEQILKQWEGLGYYSRARNFHKSCQIIALKFDGNIPAYPEEFYKLPGVGPYISAAVMSIAFHHPLPAVDTNAIRLAARLIMVKFSSPADSKIIHKYLLDNIAINRPGDFNQAIMDLGREICKIDNPKCTICPVSKFCKALVNNFVDKYPVKIKPAKKPHYNIAVGVVWNKGQILISKRRENGLLGGLWEFPGGKIERGENVENCIIREIKEELGVYVKPTTFLKQIKHAYTHFSITMVAYNCDFLHGYPQPLGCDDWRWIKPEEIKTLPFPKANHKLFDKIIVEEGIC
jgi:A/G-specific adenine glycosylase